MNIDLREIDTATAGETSQNKSLVAMALSVKHYKRFNISVASTAKRRIPSKTSIYVRECAIGVNGGAPKKWSGNDFALDKVRPFSAINRAIMRSARRPTRTEAGIGSMGKH